MASTQIILTVGLSEVPILVAAYRLCLLCLMRDGELPTFSALCIQDTTDEAERVRRLLTARLQDDSLLQPGCALRWDEVVVPHSNSIAIRNAVTDLLPIQKPGCRVHLHFTGGSRALSVHAMEAIASGIDGRGGHYSYEVSYLSPGEDVLTVGYDADLQLGDERTSWSLGIADLSSLNGFTPNFYSPQSHQCFELSEPEAELVSAGVKMLPLLLPIESRKAYGRWLSRVWEKCWKTDPEHRGWFRWPQPPPRDSWPKEDLPWIRLSPDVEWKRLTSDLAHIFGGDTVWLEAELGSVLRVQNLSEQGLSNLNQFLHYQCLELLAFDALKGSLIDLGYPKWAVHHSVHFARQSARGIAIRDFELDVVAVLGYQMLAVSCSLSSDQPALKRKAFEVLHRAKQIGGSGARTLLICALSPRDADLLMRDVEEDTGPCEKNLEIWGIDSLNCLAQRFRSYLQCTLNVPPRLR